MNLLNASFIQNGRIIKLFSILFAFFVFSSCSKDDDTYARVTVNGTLLQTNPSDFTVGDRSDFNGDVDASFTGNGGTTSRMFSWNNNLTTADYNADITATSQGTFNMVVLDADGNTVLDRSLNGVVEPDSFSGVTDAGTSGVWSVTITVSSFNGDGSFSLSGGN
ncbi:hypothetical protein [Flagellimonas ochracea]|uniref:hypothetical protein n=1 Tax=Flagellimonas ochracea TaxID=2696472 RepID=UPI001AA1B375|nr:hypothetical protein [Allomuricauda ochracea]